MNLLRSVSLLALASCALSASAQNLVVNGGFETGDFSGWTTTDASNGSLYHVADGDPHTGAYFADFAGTGGEFDTISQSIATVVGARYTVSYYLLNDVRLVNQPSNAQGFSASFGGTAQSIDLFPTTYTLQTFDVVATSSTTTLSFSGYNNIGGYHFDDVSVQVAGVPGPLAALPFALMALKRRKRA